MKKMFTAVMVGMVVMMASGCASYMSFDASRNEIVRERAFASGNEAAIKAVNMGNAVGIGIDVLNIDAITKHPWRQLGAAILDAGMIYGATVGVESINDSGSDDTKATGINIVTTGNGNSTTVNTGDNNSNVGNPNYSETSGE